MKKYTTYPLSINEVSQKFNDPTLDALLEATDNGIEFLNITGREIVVRIRGISSEHLALHDYPDAIIDVHLTKDFLRKIGTVFDLNSQAGGEYVISIETWLTPEYTFHNYAGHNDIDRHSVYAEVVPAAGIYNMKFPVECFNATVTIPIPVMVCRRIMELLKRKNNKTEE